MRLYSVSIKNYRSIEELDLEFSCGCQALIGMNESGKTNILRALALIDPNLSVLPNDLRIERLGESEVNNGSIEFEFELDEIEMIEVTKPLFEKLDPSLVNQPFLSLNGMQLTFKEFCLTCNLGSYTVKIPSGKRSASYYAEPDDCNVIPGWVYNPADSDVFVQNKNDEIHYLIKPKEIAKLDASLLIDPLEVVTAKFVNEFIGKQIRQLIPLKLPECIFWKYSDQFLLPSSLDINSFAANPDHCVPIRSMFELAGYKGTAIGEAINKARTSSPQRYIQLLRNVEKAATQYIRDTWSAQNHIKIELKSDGDLLLPLILDGTVPLDMANRSDGFKRFVSFLLQISAKVKSSEMQDVLLLIDEPEIALNPGGARSLMEELIRVGQTNLVVYSTHSIFMIDKRKINRHLIIERKNEVTTAKRAGKSKIQDDQVLYAALGYSLFEVLKEKNIIFEGWKDKEIFRVLSDFIGKADKTKKTHLSSIGLTYAEGVKDVKHISNILELAGRSCLIISDADKPAMEKRKQYEKPGAWGKWVTLKDVFGAESIFETGEDLLTRSAVIEKANIWRSNIPVLSELTNQSFTGQTCLDSLTSWLNSAGLSGKDKEDAFFELKTALFVNLKFEDLVVDAQNLIDYVLSYDFSITTK